MAVRKYLMEKGKRAFPFDSIPHSKLSSLRSPLRLGPIRCVITSTISTNPAANTSCISRGMYSLVPFISVSFGVLCNKPKWIVFSDAARILRPNVQKCTCQTGRVFILNAGLIILVQTPIFSRYFRFNVPSAQIYSTFTSS